MTVRHKAQVASLDIILSVTLLLLLLGMFIVMFTVLSDNNKAPEMGDRIFTNIKDLEPNHALLDGYRIDEAKLADFADQPIVEIEKLLFAGTDFAPEKDDVCIFFWNYSQSSSALYPANGSDDSIGQTCTTEACLTKALCDPQISDPCKNYKASYVYHKPVLRQGSVMSMYVIVCE